MNLISCRCSNCGANVQVDESKDTAVCTFCGSSFLVKKQESFDSISEDVANRYFEFMLSFQIHDGVLVKYTGNSEKVVIPKGVTAIRGAFSKCIGVKNVVIPDSVTNIDNSAFYGCMNLAEINIPDTVTHIGACAFEKCSSLTEIKLPKRIKAIPLGTFSGCSSLTKIAIPDGVTRISDEAFRGCSSLTTVIIPDSVIDCGSSAFENCDRLVQLVASDSWKKEHYMVHRCLAQYGTQNNNRNNSLVPEQTGACYVATSVYGSYDCPQVWVLRRFRDNTLSCSRRGRLFIRSYYTISPFAVQLFGQRAWFQNFWRGRLDKMVSRLKAKGVQDTPYQDQAWK